MNMKKILRSGLAIICSASMVLSCVGMIAPTVKAEDVGQTVETLPTDFTEVTPREFGITDFSGNTTQTLHQSTLKPIQSVDKVMVTAKVIFGAEDSKLTLLDNTGNGATGKGVYLIRKGANIRLVNSYTGASFYIGGQFVEGVYQGDAYSKAQYYYDMAPLTGTQNLDTTEFLLTITMEMVTFNTSGNDNDLKIGIWFNNRLYNDTYVYMRDFTIGANNIYMDTSVLAVTSPMITTEPPVNPTVYNELTPEMLGVEDATATTEGITVSTPTESIETYSLDETKFCANVKFDSATWSSVTYLYNEAGRGQLQLAVSPTASSSLLVYNRRLDGDDTTLYVGDKYEAGVNIEESYTQILANSDSSYHKILGGSKFNFLGNEFVLSVTTEFIDFDGDGNTNDLEIGIWVNGDAFAPTYCYFKDYEETTFQGILNTENLKTISSPDITNPATPVEPPTEPTVYGELTPEMLGVVDATATTEGITTTTPTESVQIYNMDKIKFSANLKFDSATLNMVTYLYNTAGRGQLKLAVSPHYSSLLLYNQRVDGNTTLYVGDKYKAGVNIEESYTQIAANIDSSFYRILGNPTFNFIGSECTISVTTEFVDFDGDASTDDLEIGIWVNGDAFEPTYCYFMDYAETTFQGVLKVENLKAISSPDVTNPATPVTPVTPPGPGNPDDDEEDEPKEETLPTDFTKVTPNFFDIDDFKDNVEDPITYQNTKSPFTSADKIMLYADVIFGNGRTMEYLYNGTTGSGIYLWAKDNLHVRNYMSPSESVGMYIGGEFVNGEYKGGTLLSGRHDNYVIKASKYSTTENFDTLKVSLILTTEFVDFDGEGTANDLKLGVWIEGKLYDNTYIYMRNCLDEYTPALKMNVVEMSSPISAGSGEKEDTVPTLPEITFSDFDIDDGTYGYNKEMPKDFAISGSYKEGFANQTFVGTVKFTDNPATHIIFAGKTSAWKGVSIVSRGDGNLSFVDANGQFPTVVIYSKLAKTKLTDRDMEIGLTFEVIDLDGDGEKDDVRFWLTLDGVLYRNKPIVKATDYAQYLGKFMGIYSEHEASSVTIKSKDIQRPIQEVDFGIMGFTKDWAKTLAAGSNSMTIGVAGNKAAYTADNTNYTNYIAICILAFVMLGGVFYSKGYGKKETD